MPPLVRRYVKTSFVFLMAGLLVGARAAAELAAPFTAAPGVRVIVARMPHPGGGAG